jgi:hypothetical protein
MARLARVIAPRYPRHVTQRARHVTQRGNRRRQAFFSNAGHETCLALRAE